MLTIEGAFNNMDRDCKFILSKTEVIFKAFNTSVLVCNMSKYNLKFSS